MPEPYKTFFLYQWIMRRITAEVLQTKVPKYITQIEYNEIVATPQMTEEHLAQIDLTEGV